MALTSVGASVVLFGRGGTGGYMVEVWVWADVWVEGQQLVVSGKRRRACMGVRACELVCGQRWVCGFLTSSGLPG